MTRSPSAALPFALIGGACIVAGGLTAAVTASAPSRVGAWSAAYLVLVAGVAQIALGVGQALLAAPSRRLIVAEFVAFTLGNAGVVLGTVVGVPLIVDVGGIVLALALILFVAGVRGAAARGGPALGRGRRIRRVLWSYRVVLVVVLVSIPVGLVLAQLRSGSS